jgi:hypothetical protein
MAKALARLGLFLAVLGALFVAYVIYDGARAARVDKACQAIVEGDSEANVLRLAGEPTQRRACGAEGYYPHDRTGGRVTNCSREYWYSTEYFGGGWLVWFDESGRVIDTARLTSP